MTEPTEIVDDRAARLARLHARRGTIPSVAQSAPSPGGQPTAAPSGSDSLPAPTAASIERTAPIDPLLGPSPIAPASSTVLASSRHARAPKSPRRRSPATSAKIITIGASTTAVLGMMAGYGISDGLTSEATEAAASTPAAPVAPVPPASPTTTPPAPVTTAPPQVIVVMVDAETGRPISTTTGSGTGVLDSALGSLLESTPSPAPLPDNGATAPSPASGASAPAEPAAAVPAAAPAEQPATPAPVAAPAAVDLAVPAPPPPPAPAPQPAPQPQASSGGS